MATTTRRGTAIPGSYFWVSRDTAVATVDQDGRVVARGNGATYVVAREDGFSAVSMRIVVRQRVARVVMTPGAASRAQGRTYTFNRLYLDSLPATGQVASSTQVSVLVADSTGAIHFPNAAPGALVMVEAAPPPRAAGQVVGLAQKVTRRCSGRPR